MDLYRAKREGEARRVGMWAKRIDIPTAKYSCFGRSTSTAGTSDRRQRDLEIATTRNELAGGLLLFLVDSSSSSSKMTRLHLDLGHGTKVKENRMK